MSSGWNGISFTADRSLLVMSKFRSRTSNGGSDKCGGIASLAAKLVAALLGLFLSVNVNRNPKDTHDHKNGVWTLPPDLSVPQSVSDNAVGWSAVYVFTAVSAANTRSLRNGGRRNRTPVAS